MLLAPLSAVQTHSLLRNMKLNPNAVKFVLGLMLRINAGVLLFVALIWFFNSKATHLMVLVALILNAIGLINSCAILWGTRNSSGRLQPEAKPDSNSTNE